MFSPSTQLGTPTLLAESFGPTAEGAGEPSGLAGSAVLDVRLPVRGWCACHGVGEDWGDSMTRRGWLEVTQVRVIRPKCLPELRVCSRAAEAFCFVYCARRMEAAAHCAGTGVEGGSTRTAARFDCGISDRRDPEMTPMSAEPDPQQLITD